MTVLLVIAFLMLLFEGVIFRNILKSDKARCIFGCVRMAIIAYILIVAVITATHILLKILYMCGILISVFYIFKLIKNVFTKNEV